MQPKPSRFPKFLTFLMVALALMGFLVSLTHSMAALKAYAVIYIASFAAWLFFIARPAGKP